MNDFSAMPQNLFQTVKILPKPQTNCHSKQCPNRQQVAGLNDCADALIIIQSLKAYFDCKNGSPFPFIWGSDFTQCIHIRNCQVSPYTNFSLVFSGLRTKHSVKKIIHCWRHRAILPSLSNFAACCCSPIQKLGIIRESTHPVNVNSKAATHHNYN